MRASHPVLPRYAKLTLVCLAAALTVLACSATDEGEAPGGVAVTPDRVATKLAVACVVAPESPFEEVCAADGGAMPGYCPAGFNPVPLVVDGISRCWCSGGCDGGVGEGGAGDGGVSVDASVDAGPPCKTCGDIAAASAAGDAGATACGRFDDGCGGQITCNTCPDGALCNLETSSCAPCTEPPDTPGYTFAPPFKGWKFELPGGQLACKALAKIPYLGTAIVAGFDRATIKASMTSGGSASSTGLKQCVETTKTTETQSWALDVCAVTLAYTANGAGEGKKTYCAECVDGVGRCGALSCDEQKETAGGRGSVTRKIREVSGVGDLILCPPNDEDCQQFAARLSKRYGIEVEGGVTASAGSKKSKTVTTPGSCSPCEDCSEEGRSFDPSLTGTVKGTFKITLLDAGRWGKIGAGLSIGAFVGFGGSVSNTVTSGACGDKDCTAVSANVQGGVFIEFRIEAFRFERNWSWVGRCQGSLGGEYCEPGGLAPTFEFKCSANDASVFDSGAD